MRGKNMNKLRVQPKNRKIKRLQNDVTELKSQGNIYEHRNSIPEDVYIQK